MIPPTTPSFKSSEKKRCSRSVCRAETQFGISELRLLERVTKGTVARERERERDAAGKWPQSLWMRGASMYVTWPWPSAKPKYILMGNSSPRSAATSASAGMALFMSFR